GGCTGPSLAVNGKAVGITSMVRKGYVRLLRTWRRGDTIDLMLPMPPQRIHANPKVHAAAGRVAMQRGPVVYCLEEVDNGPRLDSIVLPESAPLRVRMEDRLLGNVPVITARARRADLDDWKTQLYRTRPAKLRQVAIKAIPYFLWANRREGEMLVWVRTVP
ncbi:MAG: glycoside hydrolase family 127 protein, partial [Planctomycetes bacterium]|nr:glycoside hydrolase family 127 protein [Planctomycetota bacterium]